MHCVGYNIEEMQKQIYVAQSLDSGTIAETLEEPVFLVYCWEVVEVQVGSLEQKHGTKLIKALQQGLKAQNSLNMK